VNERHSVVELERRIVEAARFGAPQFLMDRPDELLVLFGTFTLDSETRSLRPMVGSATLTIARSMIVMKNETASTANARQRWSWGTGSVVIIVFPAAFWVVVGDPGRRVRGSDPAEGCNPSPAGAS
jgi:hypothetical protein